LGCESEVGPLVPASVVVVLDEPDLAKTVAVALRPVCSCVVFPDPMAALNALEQASVTELLITSIEFALGLPNGVALALALRNRHLHNVKVMFVGPFATPEQIVECAKRIMGQSDA